MNSSLSDRQKTQDPLQGIWRDYDALNALLPTNAGDHVFIGVSTARSHHERRLPVVLKTWYQLVRNNTWFFTDSYDPEFIKNTNGHLIQTHCFRPLEVRDQCCKMSAEFREFLKSDKKWFCHVDDDIYVNVPRLLELLASYDSQQDWYLGKPSFQELLKRIGKDPKRTNVTFSYATGDTGFCLSGSLALRVISVVGRRKFVRICEKLGTSYDVTIGYIIDKMLNVSLTVIDKFHSHREPLKLINPGTIHEQMTFSYTEDQANTVDLDGFDTRTDPTRFMTLHCFLFPNFSFCPTLLYEIS